MPNSRTTNRLIGVAILLLFTSLAYSSDDDDSDKHRRKASDFEYATIIVEQNATDGDTEIVIEAKPETDKGLRRLQIRSPSHRKVFDVNASRRVLGIREYRFESPEPAGEAILASYPEGDYRFSGVATDGERFSGTATLSHQLPSPITIDWPMQDQIVPSNSLTVQWSQAADAASIALEFENEGAEPAQTFTVNFPADVTSFEIPTSLLIPGADYQIGIAAVAESGNRVSTEIQFSTAD